ncbi:MAG: HEAT repeat domain-containing protein [Methanoregula sp.]|jgi:HEAT repeat protein|uniref:HEAT repeat domain-containing protein n=1 Tax=Methanoregula sp. TaxID=2052170 RepID=UPI003D125AA5
MKGEKNKWDWKDQNLPISEIIRQLDTLPTEAAYALGSRGAVEAVKPLINKLVYPPDDTVWNNLNNLAIAWALGKIKDKMAIEPLIKLLKSKSDDVRKVSAWALGQIGDKSAIPALVEALKTDEHNSRKEDSTLCEIPDLDNPEIKSIIPYIVSTCTLSRKGSSIKQALKELGYFS